MASRRERQQAQTAFTTDEADVMVATSAFGMGIDNVSFITMSRLPWMPITRRLAGQDAMDSPSFAHLPS
jgi:hypothetical protein